MITTAFFIFSLAIILALLEIEIEGKNGWAEKLPTWFRTKGVGAAVFKIFNPGKPMTGYHVCIQLLVILSFHFPFFFGLEWSLGKELMILSLHTFFTVVWDYLWFVLNPYYGARAFRRNTVWWFSKCKWVFGIIPSDYLKIFGLSVFFALGATYLGAFTINDYLTIVASVLILVFISILGSPLYRKIYLKMRFNDERSSAGIFHTLEKISKPETLEEEKEPVTSVK